MASTYSEIVNVTISLETAQVSRASFGIPVFIGAHNWFTDRIRIYNDINAVGEDIPSDSEEFAAAEAAFKQDPKINQIKIGRRDTDLLTLTPDAVTAIGQVYEVKVTGTDDVTVTSSFTTVTGSEADTDVVTALIAGLASVVGVTVGGTTTLTLAKAGTDPFSIADVLRMTVVATATESAEDALQAVEDADNDFYFVTAHDHTEAFVLAMADAVEAREKLYFVSIQEQDSIAALAVPATETLGKLLEGNYFRTAGWFHQDADTVFPEMAYVAVGAVFDPGKGIWANNRVEGITTAADPSTGIPLSPTQKNNLVQRNANFTENVGGISITRRGTVSALEWIDTIRDRDFLKSEIEADMQTLLINNPKIPYTDFGIAKANSTLKSTLDRSVETETSPNILQAVTPYFTTFPRAASVSAATKATRKLNGTFVGYLSGAIQITEIQGSLQLPTS